MRSRALDLAALALLAGLCGWTGSGPAVAQQLDAGKPPAQIFAGTCAACHRSARGLVKSVSPGSLPGFLRQHYTTGSDMAGTMAAYVLGNGGTQQVAEPPPAPPKREPKQKAKSDGPEVAAHTPEPRELSKSAKQKAAKKGQPEPAASAKEPPPRSEPEKPEPEKPEAAKPDPAKPDAAKSDTAKLEQPATEPPKAETPAVDCTVDEAKQVAAPASDEAKPGFAMPTPPATPPRQPAALLTLPGFPAPVAEPEPEPAATAHAQPGCDPTARTAAVAPRAEEPPAEQAPKEQPKESQKEQPAAISPPAMAEAPKTEPMRPAVTEPVPVVDIMREEVHAPPRAGQQKKRAP